MKVIYKHKRVKFDIPCINTQMCWYYISKYCKFNGQCGFSNRKKYNYHTRCYLKYINGKWFEACPKFRFIINYP